MVKLLLVFKANPNYTDRQGKKYYEHLLPKQRLSLLTMDYELPTLKLHNNHLWFQMLQQFESANADDEAATLFQTLKEKVKGYVTLDNDLAEALDGGEHIAKDFAEKDMKTVILSVVSWFGQFSPIDVIHMSATCYVVEVDDTLVKQQRKKNDHAEGHKFQAFKLMRNKQQWLREIESRKINKLSNDNVVDILYIYYFNKVDKKFVTKSLEQFNPGTLVLLLKYYD